VGHLATNALAAVVAMKSAATWFRQAQRKVSAVQQFWFGQENACDSGNWAVDHGRQGPAALAPTSTPVVRDSLHTVKLERHASP
jgi:hypothetical protein